MDVAGCSMDRARDAFVVLLCDDRGEHHRRSELLTTALPPCPANRPSTPPPPQPPLVTAADAYKTKPRRKDRGAFVVLPEPPAASASSSQTEPNAAATATATRSGRVSPFRGNGFKTPENGRSRAASPSSEPLRRQSSEPRISANRQRLAAKQRLSVSTKDLSKSWKPTTTVNKPPPAPTTAAVTAATAVKSSPRKKLPTGGPLQPRKVTSSSKSPLPPAGSPKTPRHSRPPAGSPKTPRHSRPPAGSPKTPRHSQPSAKSPVVNRPPPAKSSVVNRPPPAKSSPRLPKKQQTNVQLPPQPSKDADTQPPAVAAATSATTPAVSTSTTAATTTVTPTATASTAVASTPSADPSPSMAPTITPAVPVTTTTASIAPVTAAAAQSSVTASTSATAIATTHATNAVASPVVTGGPIVSAAPPPAAIAANTLLAVNPSAITALKPPQSAMRSREQFVVVKNGNLPTSTAETPAVRQSIEPTTTTPPLSYELQEIVVEPEMENQSGRTNAAVRLSDIKKTSSNNNNSNNGHKTVAWARQSEKIIVATDVPRSAEMAAATAATAETKYPDCKRFARKLLCGGSKELAPADSRSQKCWAAVWKCRPRLSNRWCYGQNDAGRQPRTAAAAAAATRPVAVAAKPPRTLRWWRRWPSCRCAVCGKRNDDRKSTAASAESVGVLGISPPTVPPSMSDTFRGRLLRWLTCCGCCHAVSKLFRRVCRCRCLCCAGRGLLLQQDAPRKSADRRSPFKCTTGCCTNKPAKLDAVLVDHSSVMKGAIPVLPIVLAWFCLVFNVIVPGAGTFFSGLMCLCVGKPRFSVNDNFQSRMGAFCVNFIVAVAQLFTVLFCLVGWGWSIWWGLIMIKMAKKYQKIKVVDQPAEAPIAIDHNHQI